MEIERYINIIIEKLSVLSTEVRLSGSLNLLSKNVLSEDVYKTILNILYDWNLENANSTELNYRAIDLIDHDSKIIIQVSSDNSNLKVQNSLDKIDVSKFSGYTFKFVSIVKRVSHLSKSGFRLPNGIKFDAKQDCYDIERITKDAKNKNIDKIKELAEYLEKVIESSTEGERRSSVITYVINCLSKVKLNDASLSIDFKPFDLQSKIEVNNLNKWKIKIDDYTVYSPIIDRIYSEYDKQGVNKSFAVLTTLRNIYLELSDNFIGDVLFDKIADRVFEIVDGDDACNQSLTREELKINNEIVLVDAFVKCKIFKKP